MLRVVLFGKFADLAEDAAFNLSFETGEMQIADVISRIGETRPQLAAELRKPSTRFVDNDVLDIKEATLRKGDELAFLPPVSGG